MNGRAALEAARSAFAPSRGRTPHETTAAPTYEPIDAQLTSVYGRASAMWQATEQALRVATERTELSGQALIAEARRLNRLTLGDAHALIALQGWVERATEHARDGASETAATTENDASLPDEQERLIASEAFMAVEHALREHGELVASAPRSDAPRSDAPRSNAPRSNAPRTATPAASATSTAPDPPPQGAYRVPPRTPPTGANTASSPATRASSRRGWLVTLLVVGFAAAGAGGWALWQRRGLSDYRNGVAAFNRGDRSAARAALARSAQQRPNDARPLILLGRIAREQQDYTQARRYLQAAVRVEPTNALASRELASALLADGEPELARRFYVYAIERDPTDRVAQGFLGCALVRLGRADVAAKWFARAGSGEWSVCAQSSPPTTAPQ